MAYLYTLHHRSLSLYHCVAIGPRRQLIGLTSTATVSAEKAEANAARASVVAVTNFMGPLQPPIVAEMDGPLSWDPTVLRML